MKVLILSLLLSVSISASANEYWDDQCDVTKVAKDFVIAAYPQASFDLSKHCSRVAYVSPENASCIQSEISRGFFQKEKAHYKVIVKTEQSVNYDVRIQAEYDDHGGCRVTMIELKNIIQ